MQKKKRNNKLKEGSLEVIVFFIGKWSVFNFLPFVGQFIDLILVHLDFDWLKGQSFNQVQVGVTSEGSQNPEEWLFILIV